MKKLNNLLFALLLLSTALFSSGAAYAADERTVSLRIEGPDALIMYESLGVPESCEAQDNEGKPHFFDGFKAICALQVAKDKGLVTGFSGDMGGFGFFLTSIHDIENAPWTSDGLSPFWVFRVNNADPGLGISSYEVQEGDSVLFAYGPWPMAPLGLTGSASAQKDKEVSFDVSLWDDTIGAFQPYSGFATLSVDGVEHAVTPGSDGVLFWAFGETGIKQVRAEAENKTPSEYLSITVAGVTPSFDGVAPASSPGGGTVASSAKDFDSPKALQFLLSRQQGDGSFGNKMVSDWAGIALGSADGTNAAKEQFISYLAANPDPGPKATDLERRAMALMALGESPYKGANYIAAIEREFSDGQIGDPAWVNDDIFGLLVLRKAGYTPDEDSIQETLAFLLKEQEEDGSWGSVDLTAAAMQTLALFSDQEGVPASLDKAKEYLKKNQRGDGGFGNSFSTSWVLQAIAALGDTPASWANAGRNGEFALAEEQESDGGLAGASLENRIWATASALPASLGKPWGEILASFEKPQSAVSSSGGGLSSSSAPEQDMSDGSEKPKESASKNSVQSAASAAFGDLFVWGEVSIPEAAQAIGQEWDGTLQVRISDSQEALTGDIQNGKTAEDVLLEDLDPVGFLEADPGVEERLLFDAPLEVAIPVFAEEGEELSVYVRSSLQEAFIFLNACRVEGHVCRVQTSHLSQFVATRKQAQKLPSSMTVEERQQEIERIQAEIAILQLRVAELRGQEETVALPAEEEPENLPKTVLRDSEQTEEESGILAQQEEPQDPTVPPPGNSLLEGLELATTQSAQAEQASKNILQLYRKEIFGFLLALGFALLGLYGVLALRAQKRSRKEQALMTIPQAS